MSEGNATAKFTIADAASAARAYSDQTHKYWGYFQLASAATAAFAWTAHPNTPPIGPYTLMSLLLIAYIVFAVANSVLVVGSQKAAWKAFELVARYIDEQSSELDRHLRQVPLLNKPSNPKMAGGVHIGIIIGVVGAVLTSPLGVFPLSQMGNPY